MAPVTTERGDGRRVCAAPALALLVMCVGVLPAAAQDAPGAAPLLERLRQIQGELQVGTQPAQPPSGAEELIGRIQVIEAELRPAAGPAGPPALSEDEVRAGGPAGQIGRAHV